MSFNVFVIQNVKDTVWNEMNNILLIRLRQWRWSTKMHAVSIARLSRLEWSQWWRLQIFYRHPCRWSNHWSPGWYQPSARSSVLSSHFVSQWHFLSKPVTVSQLLEHIANDYCCHVQMDSCKRRGKDSFFRLLRNFDSGILFPTLLLIFGGLRSRGEPKIYNLFRLCGRP